MKRSRVRADRQFHRSKSRSKAIPVAVAASLAVVTAGYSILQYFDPMTTYAKESFSGIGKIVEEHNQDDPYHVLDIVPAEACYDEQTVDAGGNVTSSKRYTFAAGTLGYLTNGGITLTQELKTVYTENEATYRSYEKRQELFENVISQTAIESFPGIKYEEAYGGVHTDHDEADGWSLLFDSKEINSSPVDLSTLSEGVFKGTAESAPAGVSGEEYAFKAVDTGGNFSLRGGMHQIYQSNPGNGGWHVIFTVTENPESADILYMVDEDEVHEYNVGSYSKNTALYLKEGDGLYRYAGTVNQIVYGHSEQYETAPEEASGGTTTGGNTGGSTGSGNTGNGNAGNNTGSSNEGENAGSSNEGGSTGGGNEGGNTGSSNEGGNEGGNTGNSNEGGSTGNGNEGGNTGNSNEGGSTGNGNEGGNTGSTNEGGSTGGGNEGGSTGNGNEGGNTGNSNEGGNTGSTNEGGSTGGGNEGGNTGSGNEGGNTGNSNEGGNAGSTNEGGSTGGGLSSASTGRWYKMVETGGENSENEEETPRALTNQYFVLSFVPVDYMEQDGIVYYVPEQETEISRESSVAPPFDTYELLQAGAGMENYGVASLALTSPTVTGKYVYVGPGNGDVKLVPSDSDTASYLGVYNTPVYIRCNSGNSWLEQYVFSSLENGDNERSSFAIEVETVRADKVTSDMIGEADLVYLESGINTIINPGLYLDYIQAGADNWIDMGEGIAGELLRRAADDLLPVIVDYDIVESEDHYKDTNYQYLTRALLKKDLATFYAEMNVKGNLMDNLKMNVSDNDDYPNKTDNNYHYVNKNVYVVNDDTSLVSEDFHDYFDDDETERGFSDVIAAIKAENTTLSEDNQISEKVSKARAIQYIINYSVGIVGEFGDLRILEIQPTANTTSDLQIVVDDKKNTKLCWKTEGMKTAKQILSSKKSFDVKTTIKSVVQFNGEWEDINTSYDLVFIGLDGQRLNLGTDKNRSPVYNNEKLNGKVYHTGDDSGVGTYDSNDITAQKMSDLLEYMEAGYPVMVENNCFKGGSARKVNEDDINTKYIDKDSVMYRFLKSAVTDDRYKDRIYTVSDTMSSAMFITQINIGKPKLELQQEGDTQPAKLQQLSLDENQEYHGKIAYKITDRKGEGYLGDTELHLYVDLNYDGMFSEQEELDAQVNEGNIIDVKINGMGPGILSWKLEIVDSGNHYRRDSLQGYFELLSPYPDNVSVLQITESKDNAWMNLQEMYENMDNSLLAYCLKGAESIANLTMQFETVTAGELSTKLSTDSAYLDQWDVIVLTLDNNGANDSIADAVTKYVNDGRSLLVCSQDTGGNRMGLSAELLGQTQENRTYVTLGANGAGGYYRYAGLKSDMFAPLTQLQSEQVNEGSIAYYPYQLENRTFTCGTNSALRASEYLLDFENNLKSESDTAYVTVWYTLGGGGADSAYNISPNDARNNYYCYSKGNVVYLGQAEYPYSYNSESGDKPESNDGIDECKFFVNAMMAAYSAGVHNADVSVVAGFGTDAAEIQSITVPFDQEWKDASDETEGILDNTVDVYFKFADSNIAMDKNVQISFYYEDPVGSERLNVQGKTVQATPFASEIWTVTDNKLVAAAPENLQPGKVYRIKAPVVTLKTNSSMNNANIYVVLHSKFRRGSKSYEISGADAVSLNRAQMFLLE